MVNINNDFLSVSIKLKGAELCSIVHKKNGLQYMWAGDPAIWGKTSPLLFPIVGTLKDNTLIYNHEKYMLPRHGFARDMQFTIEEHKKDSVVFVLQSSITSLEKYPFNFILMVKYKILDDSLYVTYHVKNAGDKKMFFSIGGHPAFAIPLVQESTYEDYYLQFNQLENAGHWPISRDGLIEDAPLPFFNYDNKIDLTKALFQNDALVFKHLKSNLVSLKSKVNSHGLDFDFSGFHYLGIWAAKNADFICIEPWCGIADSVSHDQNLQTKEGIETLQPNGFWARSWNAKFY